MKAILVLIIGVLFTAVGCQKSQLAESRSQEDFSGTYSCSFTAGNIQEAGCDLTIYPDQNLIILAIDNNEFEGYTPEITIGDYDSGTIPITPCTNCLLGGEADILFGEISKVNGKVSCTLTMKDDDWLDGLIFTITEL